MDQRLKFHEVLIDLFPEGKDHVYFQPPPDFKMQYPCIVYKLTDIDTIFANNSPYYNKKRWQVTSIDDDPDSNLPNKLANLPLNSFQRAFVKDNLNHSVFYIYF